MQSILDSIGIDPGRVQMVNVSAAMAAEFIAQAAAMVERLTEIGPSPFRDRP